MLLGWLGTTKSIVETSYCVMRISVCCNISMAIMTATIGHPNHSRVVSCTHLFLVVSCCSRQLLSNDTVGEHSGRLLADNPTGRGQTAHKGPNSSHHQLMARFEIQLHHLVTTILPNPEKVTPTKPGLPAVSFTTSILNETMPTTNVVSTVHHHDCQQLEDSLNFMGDALPFGPFNKQPRPLINHQPSSTNIVVC